MALTADDGRWNEPVLRKGSVGSGGMSVAAEELANTVGQADTLGICCFGEQGTNAHGKLMHGNLMHACLLFSNNRPVDGMGGASMDGMGGATKGSRRKVDMGVAPALINRLWGIHADEIEQGPMVGKGGFGEVYEAVYNGTHVAIKKILFDEDMPIEIKHAFRSECQMNVLLRHPNLVLFIGLYEKPHEFVLVVELCEEGSAYDYMNGQDPPALHERRRLALKLAQDVARGMSYLHGRNPPVIHHDLKTPNLLITEGLVGKVSDFGMSRMLRRDPHGAEEGGGGSLMWAAPELLMGGRGSAAGDMYAFSIVLWELLHWSEPYKGMPLLKVAELVASGERMDVSDEVSTAVPGARALLESAWHEAPAQRPSFIEVLQRLQDLEDAIGDE